MSFRAGCLTLLTLASASGAQSPVTLFAFARAVVAAVPGAKFAGPDAAGRTLVHRFVAAEKDSGCLALVTQHTYVGGNPRKRGIDTPHAIESMLSREWVTQNYPQLYRSVTLINKEHGPNSRGAASVTLNVTGFSPAQAATMVLTAPDGNVGATTGVTLGGEIITNDRPWHGQWTPLTPTQGRYVVLVPAASAAVVKLTAP